MNARPLEGTVIIKKAGFNTPDVQTISKRQLIIDAFLASQTVKDSSLKTYRESLNQYFKWLDNTGRDLSAISEEDIVAYQKQLEMTHQNLTVRSYITAVKKFYAWSARRGIYPNVADAVKPPKANQGGKGAHFIKMHLTNDEAAELLKQYGKSPRNYAMVNLMLRTGMRTIEVSRATIGDIKLRSGRRILEIWGKGMNSRDSSVFVILTEAAYQPIADYLATRPGALPGEPLFATEGKGYNKTKKKGYPDGILEHSGNHMSTRSIQMIVKNGLRSIGLDDHAYSAHSLRHTTATQIIKNGGSLLDVKRTLRHSSINTSMIYTASIEDEERLQNPAEALLDNSFITEK